MSEKEELPISEIISQYSEEKQKDIIDYLSSLNEHQKKAYLIAYNHLNSSFNIIRSNGFKEWKKLQK